jgi:hypothetical protein
MVQLEIVQTTFYKNYMVKIHLQLNIFKNIGLETSDLVNKILRENILGQTKF